MDLKFKKLVPEGVIPRYAKSGDAGLDLTATSVSYDPVTNILTYGVGLAVEIPEGHVGLLYPRSSIYKYVLALANSTGIIDSGYRSEIMLKFRPIDGQNGIYQIGDRIGQLIVIPYPKMNPIEVDELSETERGDQGFGSSGR